MDDPSNEIPAEVRSLIAGQLESVVQLELLLLFHRDPTRSWTPREVAAELRIEPTWSATQMNLLVDRRLLALTEPGAASYRYSPATPELAHSVDLLARTYADRRVTLIAAIYSRPTDAVRTFADAFRLRKESRDG